ncbi:MAG TPA: hypothetical protein VKA86_04925 [Candidatus Krumholzibacteria bacterium]|nr:hypothetical protein [Candidatus Krumholzibacteria bacterium]
MSKTGIFTLIFLLVVGALMYSALKGVDSATCEVCVTFNGRTECRTGQGRDRNAAVQKAQTAACAVLATGRAASIKCGNATPTSVSCD